MYEWKDIPWKKIQRTVFKLQKRIYRASKRGDVKQVRKLQKLLVKSQSARLVSVRRVTQDNRGKLTAGVDGVKSLNGKQRSRLANRLDFGRRAKPLRRVWIPKPNSDEKRPLGIPTMHDRALQALLKTALEPEWEARFEPNSYGFRPGRSAHDAIAAIFTCINQRSKWVLDGDIEKCFDKIDHRKLLDKVNTVPSFRQTIKGWLKAGIMEEDVFAETEAGTPQGGVISPLLANIALHGMETFLQEKFRQKRVSRTKLSPKVTFIRYADDFVVFHEDMEVLEDCRGLLEKWLEELGLKMKPSKTRIAHTLKGNGQSTAGFDFLGMTVRQFTVGRTHSGKDQRGKPLGYKTIIKPSLKSQKRHYLKLREITTRQCSSPQEALIRELNPVVIGWCNNFSKVVAKDVFSHMDFLLYNKLRRWTIRRHNGKHRKIIARKYWRLEKGTWKFGTKKGVKLHYHSATPITRHIKVKGDSSPMDGNWVYWGARLYKHSGISKRKMLLLKRQGGRCTLCRIPFSPTDLLEEDHIIPRIKGGKDEAANCQLLHAHCHHQKTKSDGSLKARGSGTRRGAV